MIRQLFVVLILFSSFNVLFSQSKTETYVELFPSVRNFSIPIANYEEAKLGLQYYPEDGNLKLDIGNSKDLFSIVFPDSKARISFGVQFMAFGLSTSYEGKRLQIDALDGFFGGDVSFSKMFGNVKLFSRVRIIHNSAHFVDGHWDRRKEEWIDNIAPIPYSRDYIEFTLGREHFTDLGTFKYYGSGAYSFLVRPEHFKRYTMNLGFEIYLTEIFGKFLDKEVSVLLSDHFYLKGEPKYSGNNNAMCGIRFGELNKSGVVFYVSYFTGNNMFSEYYFEKVKKFGIGFFVDFL